MHEIKKMLITEYDNPPLIKGGYPFTYEDSDDSNLKQLREKYSFEKLISKGKTEFEQLLILRDWVSSRFNHGYCKRCPKETPLEVLERAKQGECFTCATFAEILVAVFTSVGFVARNLTVYIKNPEKDPSRPGGNGHCVTEVWSNQFRKWIMLDADLKAHFEKDGVPLSAYEIRKYWISGRKNKILFVRGENPPSAVSMGSNFSEPQMAHYMSCFMEYNSMNYYCHLSFYMINTHFSKKGNYFLLRLVDSHSLPFLMQNGKPIDSDKMGNTNNLSDIYYNLNVTHIDISCQSANKKSSSALNVSLSSETPWFDSFLVRFNEGKWQVKAEKFNWKVKKGNNLIEAKSVNCFGREGIASRINVKCI